MPEKKDDRELPMIWQCAWCKEWADEYSEQIANSRIKIECVVTHTICEDCEKKLN